MAPYEECTWNESHVMWHLPLSACAHVTHGTWQMDHMKDTCQVRGCFLFLDQTKNNKFGGGEKEKREKKGRKKRKERKTKEMRKKIVCVKERKKGKERKREKREKKSVGRALSNFRCSVGRKSIG